MSDLVIKYLKDLNNLRSAPDLNNTQKVLLLEELSIYMKDAEWFTIGIMASSLKLAIDNLKEMESFFNWPEMKIKQKPDQEGPVFLKANQNTRDIYIRVEHGLGEGILITCQKTGLDNHSNTFGPFPLHFFQIKG